MTSIEVLVVAGIYIAGFVLFQIVSAVMTRHKVGSERLDNIQLGIVAGLIWPITISGIAAMLTTSLVYKVITGRGIFDDKE